MRRKTRIQLYTVKCRRGCGRDITATSRSIHGANALHTKYSGICSHCITDEERNEMLYGIGSAIIQGANNA